MYLLVLIMCTFKLFLRFINKYWFDTIFFFFFFQNLHHQTTHKNFIVDEIAPVTIPPTVSQAPISTTSTTTIKSVASNSGRSKSTKPDDILNYEDNYDYGEYDDEDDDIEDPVESETIIPDLAKKKQTFVPTFEDTESITTEQSNSKTTTRIEAETEPILISSTTRSTTTTTTSTTPVSIETTPEAIPTTVSTTTTTTTTESPITPTVGVDIDSEVKPLILVTYLEKFCLVLIIKIE